MDFENDQFISREILLGAMRQAAKFRDDNMIPEKTHFESETEG